ncbi:PRTRC system ThiF family protein [Neiella marina]|uniref:PRTRC system ThiF family protein n=1 Tax=Neiella holothuriorum TaxID=2870530 RepID=A0ABS7EHW7_9GAMM|nr:PRTRC system ThiF family protein [Neiella holothuriorum]MBW8191351.1 PRTRC system ThiF family protein [Neiella holothuriorum]
MNSNHFITPHSMLTDTVDITLIGAGGTGGELLQQLWKMHHALTKLGHDGFNVTVYDGDIVTESNVGRQPFWPCDLALNKAEVLVKRFNAWGGTDWKFRPEYADANAIVGGLRYKPYELLITCVDKASFRAELGVAANQFRGDNLWIDAGNGASNGQVILGHIGSKAGVDLRLPNVFDLFPSLANIEDNDEDSCSHEEAFAKQDFGINVDMASAIRGLIWQMLRYGRLEHHGVFVDMQTADTTPLKIDPLVWSTFGYGVAS